MSDRAKKMRLEAERDRQVAELDIARKQGAWNNLAARANRLANIEVELAALGQGGPRNVLPGRRTVRG